MIWRGAQLWTPKNTFSLGVRLLGCRSHMISWYSLYIPKKIEKSHEKSIRLKHWPFLLFGSFFWGHSMAFHFQTHPFKNGIQMNHLKYESHHFNSLTTRFFTSKAGLEVFDVSFWLRNSFTQQWLLWCHFPVPTHFGHRFSRLMSLSFPL